MDTEDLEAEDDRRELLFNMTVSEQSPWPNCLSVSPKRQVILAVFKKCSKELVIREPEV